MVFHVIARRLIAAAAALMILVAADASRAQQPSPTAIALAKELLELKGSNAMFDPLVPGIVETVNRNFATTNTGLVKELNDVAVQLRAEFAPRRNEIANEFAMYYARRFSEQEMRDVIAFFKSPSGKKFLAAEPDVMDEGMKNLNSWSNRLAEEVIARFRVEMKKKGHDL